MINVSTDASVVLQIRSYITTLDPQLAETQQWKRGCRAAISVAAGKGGSDSRIVNVAAAREGHLGNVKTVIGMHTPLEVIYCPMCPPSSAWTPAD